MTKQNVKAGYKKKNFLTLEHIEKFFFLLSFCTTNHKILDKTTIIIQMDL